jgi:Zn-dependent protease
MLAFQEPPPTRYDLNFNLAGIPVRVHPLFWLVTLLFGASAGGIVGVLVWVAVVFVSILVHEMGHALAMRFYGWPSRITLFFGGGLTVPETSLWNYRGANVSLPINQEIIISLAGPGAGFLLATLVIVSALALGGQLVVGLLFGLLPFPGVSVPFGGGVVNLIVQTLLWVNIFWGLINLAPVIPLDGGQVARLLWLKADPWDGVRKSLWLSVIAGAIIALLGLVLMQSIFIALMFGFMALQSYQVLQGRSIF